jgi:hypothetical protein
MSLSMQQSTLEAFTQAIPTRWFLTLLQPFKLARWPGLTARTWQNTPLRSWSKPHRKASTSSVPNWSHLSTRVYVLGSLESHDIDCEECRHQGHSIPQIGRRTSPNLQRLVGPLQALDPPKGPGVLVDHFTLYLAIGVVLMLAIGTLSYLAGRTSNNRGGKSKPPPPDNPNATPPSDPLLIKSLSPAFSARELFFGPTQETSLISISRIKSPTFGSRGRDVHPTGIDAGRLNALAQILPTVLQGISRHGSTWMRVVVNGQLESSGNGLLLPFVRDNHGRITELARLDPGGFTAVATNAASFWQIASVIVAQKQLADISAKLSAILNRLDEIKAFMEAERRARITGPLDYLEQLVACIKAGEIPSIATHKIEDIEMELLSVQDHVLDDYRRLIEDIDSYQDTEWCGSEQMFNKLGSCLSELEKLNEVWALCGKVRILNVQILSALPSSTIALHERLRSFRVKNDALQGSGGIKDRVCLALKAKIDKIESWFNLQTTIDARRNEIRLRLSKVMGSYEHLRQNIDEQLRSIETGRQRLPIQLEAKIENGKIVVLKQLPA